jgi:hypothetical protein
MPRFMTDERASEFSSLPADHEERERVLSHAGVLYGHVRANEFLDGDELGRFATHQGLTPEQAGAALAFLREAGMLRVLPDAIAALSPVVVSPPPDPASWRLAELEALTVEQLREQAKQRGIPQPSKWRKAELVQVLSEPPPMPPLAAQGEPDQSFVSVPAPVVDAFGSHLPPTPPPS